jgi:hypothetical protein
MTGPGVKLVALQKGTNQKKFTCAVLNRNDLGDGEDWMRDDKVQGGSVGWKGRIGRRSAQCRSSS